MRLKHIYPFYLTLSIRLLTSQLISLLAILCPQSGGGMFSSAPLPRYSEGGRGSRQARLYRTVLTVSVVNRLDDIASQGN